MSVVQGGLQARGLTLLEDQAKDLDVLFLQQHYYLAGLAAGKFLSSREAGIFNGLDKSALGYLPKVAWLPDKNKNLSIEGVIVKDLEAVSLQSSSSYTTNPREGVLIFTDSPFCRVTSPLRDLCSAYNDQCLGLALEDRKDASAGNPKYICNNLNSRRMKSTRYSQSTHQFSLEDKRIDQGKIVIGSLLSLSGGAVLVIKGSNKVIKVDKSFFSLSTIDQVEGGLEGHSLEDATLCVLPDPGGESLDIFSSGGASNHRLDPIVYGYSYYFLLSHVEDQYCIHMSKVRSGLSKPTLSSRGTYEAKLDLQDALLADSVLHPPKQKKKTLPYSGRRLDSLKRLSQLDDDDYDSSLSRFSVRFEPEITDSSGTSCSTRERSDSTESLADLGTW